MQSNAHSFLQEVFLIHVASIRPDCLGLLGTCVWVVAAVRSRRNVVHTGLYKSQTVLLTWSFVFCNLVFICALWLYLADRAFKVFDGLLHVWLSWCNALKMPQKLRLKSDCEVYCFKSDNNFVTVKVDLFFLLSYLICGSSSLWFFENLGRFLTCW